MKTYYLQIDTRNKKCKVLISDKDCFSMVEIGKVREIIVEYIIIIIIDLFLIKKFSSARKGFQKDKLNSKIEKVIQRR